MTRLITIAGPQSSGKTTLFNHLKKKYKKYVFLPEINPKSITGKKDFGAINTYESLERRITKIDIDRIKKIDRNNKIIVIETGIFHYVWTENFLDKKTAEKYFKKYLDVQKKFHSFVIFIDTKPDISWKRRKEIYKQRILNKGIHDKSIIKKYLQEYKKIIFNLYPLWLKCYKKIPFEKIMIKNSTKAKTTFLKQAEKIILSLLSQPSL